MKGSGDVKEKIIEATMGLIAESAGDIADISTRTIAERTHIGTGLINYHFQTKENLIEICVERMIGKVIAAFTPSTPEQTPTARLKSTAKQVFDFLVDNPAVSRISILSDHKNPKKSDSTMKSAMGMNKVLGKLEISEKEQFVLAFALTSAMQAMFLRKDQSGELFGYDMNVKEQRDKVLGLLIDTMFGGFEHE
ncbi:MAG: TetR/AcrR family transcriptional regulator [Firmicutes bacterium]|nr:TetR/AcrR family transcriptional regulator [Bacillota bacterium]